MPGNNRQRTGYLQFNVGAAYELQSLHDDLAQRFLTEAELFRLLDAAGDRDRLLLEVIYYSGMRISSLIGLCWQHLNQNRLTVHGKGRKTNVIVLPERIALALMAAKPAQAGLDDSIFVRPRTGKAMNRTDVTRIVKRAAKAIGKSEVSPHWLRHAHASHALDRGASVAIVRDTLGHSNVSVTNKYLHARPDDSSGLYLSS